jgi:hypothetical protein
MGLLRSTVQSLGAAVVLIHALSLAGLGTSLAAASHVSGTGYVNGMPCNDLCKAYMAWSDQVMANSRRSQPQMRVVVPRKRLVVPRKRPDRTVRRASGTRRLGPNLFAQLPRRSDAALQSVETPHVQVASPEPVPPITERLFPSDGIVTARPADAVVATNAFAETTPVPVTGLVAAAQDTNTASHFAPGLDGRFALSVGLALCALLSLLSWVCLRSRM